MTVPAVEIDAVGMACPIGLTAASACAAMRAGVVRVREMGLRDNDGEPVIGSMLGLLPERASRGERSLLLLGYALRDMRSGAQVVDLAQTAMFLKLPPGRGGRSFSGHEVANILTNELGVAIDGGLVHVAAEDVDAYQLVAAARTRILEGEMRGCLVCAADSLIDPRSLLALARGFRLKTATNADGVIPGEAAAGIRLVRRSARALARVRGFGSAMETGLMSNDVPLRGEGIAAAARDALGEAGLGMHELDFRLSDAAGEAYSFKEQTLVLARLLRHNMAAFPLWLGAHTLGHVGRAAGMCNLIWATMAMARSYAPGPRAIAFIGDDGGRRSALVFERGRDL